MLVVRLASYGQGKRHERFRESVDGVTDKGLLGALEAERDIARMEVAALRAGQVQYPRYAGDPWWCTVHNRPATHMFVSLGGVASHHCDPKLGGIMLPCQCVPFDKTAPHNRDKFSP